MRRPGTDCCTPVEKSNDREEVFSAPRQLSRRLGGLVPSARVLVSGMLCRVTSETREPRWTARSGQRRHRILGFYARIPPYDDRNARSEEVIMPTRRDCSKLAHPRRQGGFVAGEDQACGMHAMVLSQLRSRARTNSTHCCQDDAPSAQAACSRKMFETGAPTKRLKCEREQSGERETDFPRPP